MIAERRNTDNPKMCHKCKVEANLKKRMETPIENFFLKGNSRIKYSHLRKIARDVMERHGVEKTCAFCTTDEFDPVVQVAHIRAITSFPGTALVSEVNNRRNLIYMCPSHHKLFDGGFIGFIFDLKGKAHFFKRKDGTTVKVAIMPEKAQLYLLPTT